MTTELSIIFEQLRQMQSTGDDCRAGALWAAHIETLLNAGESTTAATLLAELPPTHFHENRDLCYVEGLLLARQGDIRWNWRASIAAANTFKQPITTCRPKWSR